MVGLGGQRQRPSRLAHLQAPILRVPAVVGLGTNAVLPADLFCLYPRFPFLQNCKNLLLPKPAPLHRESSSWILIPENSHFHWTSFPGAGQQREIPLDRTPRNSKTPRVTRSPACVRLSYCLYEDLTSSAAINNVAGSSSECRNHTSRTPDCFHRETGALLVPCVQSRNSVVVDFSTACNAETHYATTQSVFRNRTSCPCQ